MSRLVKPGAYVRPTEDTFRFELRSGVVPEVPPVGARTSVFDLARRVLVDGDADRFRAAVNRWAGPEDRAADGAQPYLAPQEWFVERGHVDRVLPADVEAVLSGDVLVFRGERRVDYVMRDHHVIDVMLHAFSTTGELPRGIFHVDRHSDWADDRHLRARTPDQAATWWSLLHGIRRPGGGTLLDEHDVHFCAAPPPAGMAAPGRTVGAAVRVPGSLDPATLNLDGALERAAARAADWVSLDLDAFQPATQLRTTRHVLRSAAVGQLWRHARVGILCLSPQFTLGGDRFEDWRVHGSRHSSLRLVNLLRAAR